MADVVIVDYGAGNLRSVARAVAHAGVDAEVTAVPVAALVDFTVVTVMDAATKEMVYMDRFNRVDYTLLTDRLARSARGQRISRAHPRGAPASAAAAVAAPATAAHYDTFAASWPNAYHCRYRR